MLHRISTRRKRLSANKTSLPWGTGLWFVPAVVFFITCVPGMAMAQQASISLKALEKPAGHVEISVDITDVADLDAGQFDLGFDPAVITVTGVRDGSVERTPVPIAQWAFLDKGRVRVLFNLPGVRGISGSGVLATISCTVTGRAGDISPLDISRGLLVNTMADKIPARWIGSRIGVETSARESGHAPEPFNDASSEPEQTGEGMVISTSLVVSVFSILAVLPFLVLAMNKRKRSR